MEEWWRYPANSFALCYLLAAFLGACFGSFVTVLVHRVPLMVMNQNPHHYTLFLPHSQCPKCDASLRWYHNVPVISWLVLRGKCHFCQAKISCRYPLTESFFMVLAVIMAFCGVDIFTLIFSLFFCGMLFALALIDLRYMLLPDMLTLSLLWGGLLYHAVFGEGELGLKAGIYGAMAGYLSLWLLRWAFYGLTGREGLGGGDLKLLAALGAWSGWSTLPAILLLSASLGILMMLVIRLTGKKTLSEEMPFGPFLATAGLIFHFI